MEQITTQLRALVSPTTRRGRAIRTTLQAIVGLTTFAIALLSIPGFEGYLAQLGIVVTVGTIGVWIGVVAYIQNAAESLIIYLWGQDGTGN